MPIQTLSTRSVLLFCPRSLPTSKCNQLFSVIPCQASSAPNGTTLIVAQNFSQFVNARSDHRLRTSGWTFPPVRQTKYYMQRKELQKRMYVSFSELCSTERNAYQVLIQQPTSVTATLPSPADFPGLGHDESGCTDDHTIRAWATNLSFNTADLIEAGGAPSKSIDTEMLFFDQAADCTGDEQRNILLLQK